MKTRSTPTFSFISLMIGADALAVFDPREIIDLEKSISSSFAPGTNISISSLSFGVEAIIIFLAPLSKCFWASSEIIFSFWVNYFFGTHYALLKDIKIFFICFNIHMSTNFNTENNHFRINESQNKVKVTDLLSRLNEEKKIEKKRNLALGVAAVSAVTVFGIILTI